LPDGLEWLFIVLSLGFTAFWIWMLVDCMLRITTGDKKKIGWLIAIALTHVLGAFAFFFFGRGAQAEAQS
jgi:hypothetical protein